MTENIINFRADGHFTIHSEYMNFKGSLFFMTNIFSKAMHNDMSGKFSFDEVVNYD